MVVLMCLPHLNYLAFNALRQDGFLSYFWRIIRSDQIREAKHNSSLDCVIITVISNRNILPYLGIILFERYPEYQPFQIQAQKCIVIIYIPKKYTSFNQECKCKKLISLYFLLMVRYLLLLFMSPFFVIFSVAVVESYDS